MKTIWAILMLGFVLLMHTQAARATESIIVTDPVALSTGDEERPPRAGLDSIIMECGRSGVEDAVCYADCYAKAFVSGGKLRGWTCRGWDERMNLVCGCTIEPPSVGPYNPPCYINCNNRSRTGIY